MTGNADPTPGDAAGTGDGVMSGNKGPTFWLAVRVPVPRGRGTRDSVPAGSGGRKLGGLIEVPSLSPGPADGRRVE